MTQLPSKELQRLASKGPSLKPRIYFSSDRDEGFREAEFAYAYAHFTWKRHAKLDEQHEA